MRLRAVVGWSLGLLTAVSACAPSPDHRPREPASAAETDVIIEWRSWGPDAFAEARRDGRMVLLDVGMEGCTACRWMDELTYADPRVARLVTEHFVPISVDAEARPDVGERYSNWAWPATIVLAPDGTQAFAMRGNRLPKNFIPILEQLIEAHATGQLTADDRAPIAAPTAAQTGPLAALRDDVVRRTDRGYDLEGAGWGKSQKTVSGRHVEHAFLRAHARGEAQWRTRAVDTLTEARALLDPVWGGVFVGGFGTWSEIIPEKRLGSNAGALRGFSEAYALTRDPAMLEAAEAVDHYLRGMLRSEAGTFFTSQEDDAPALGDLDARAYYRLDDAGRRAHGIPPIDHTVYSDLNAEAIRGYLALARATEDPHYREIARRALERLVEQRQTPAGWFLQHAPSEAYRSDNRMRALPPDAHAYLAPQGVMGLALLELYAQDQDPRWLERAQALASGLEATLADSAGGGFFASDDTSVANVVPRRKPPEANARAARFLYLLSVYTKDTHLRESAVATVRAVSQPQTLDPEGRVLADLAIALELLTTGYVEFTVVTDTPEDPRAQALLRAAQQIYEPRRVIHTELPGRYPDAGRPTLFVCSPTACSRPIQRPEDVAKAAKPFAGLP